MCLCDATPLMSSVTVCASAFFNQLFLLHFLFVIFNFFITKVEKVNIELNTKNKATSLLKMNLFDLNLI